jgi:double-strand break repair protein MRE11
VGFLVIGAGIVVGLTSDIALRWVRHIVFTREYMLGYKPIQVELLSDPDKGKADGFLHVPTLFLYKIHISSTQFRFPAIIYEDPNFNIAIPIFLIHGNHDDPQGARAVS